MYMKNHILAAMREEFNHWERVLARLSEAQITAIPQPGEMSIKDEIAHLYAWQQRSLARMEAGLHNRPPIMPQWPSDIDIDSEAGTDQINAWIDETYRSQSWTEVYQNWRTTFLRLLEVAEAIPEPALLDSSRYAWLKGYSLAFILVSSYDHHQEHLEKLLARINDPHQSQPSDLPKTSAPAQRALDGAGIATLDQLGQFKRAEIAKLHGMGPKAIGILQQALAAKGLTFAGE